MHITAALKEARMAEAAKPAERKAGDDHSCGVHDKEYEKFLGLVEKRRHV